MNTPDHTKYTDALRLKSALEQVLGADEWYRLKDSKSLTTWKFSLTRALRVSKSAIIGTVLVADAAWHSEAEGIVDKGIQDVRSSTSILDAIASFAACYFLLSFHQLGFVPKSIGRKKRVVASPRQWRMDDVRSVLYVQNDEQRLAQEFQDDPRPFHEKVADPKYRHN